MDSGTHTTPPSSLFDVARAGLANSETGVESLRAIDAIERAVGEAEAATTPLEVDVSDYSDEFCEGFIAGQRNAAEYLLRRSAGV